MTIRARTWLLVGIVSLVLAVALILAARVVILDGFRNIEIKFAGDNLARAVNVLNSTMEKINTSAGDYASWDDTYEFVRDTTSGGYIEGNFIASAFANVGIQGMLYFDTTGLLLAQAWFADAEAERSAAPIPLTEAIMKAPGLLRQTDSSSGTQGIVVTGATPYMVAARPILKNDRVGPSRGSLVFARELDSAELARLSGIVEMKLTVRVADTHNAAVMDSLSAAFVASGSTRSVRAVGDRTLSCHAMLFDLAENTPLVLACQTQRPIYAHGLQTFFYGIIWLITVVIVFAAVILTLLERGVLSRINWLSNAIGSVKDHADASERIMVLGRDEIASLASDVNGMLDALSSARSRADVSEKRYALLFEQMLNGFALHELIMDKAGKPVDYRFVEVNPAFERITGIRRDDAVGKTVKQMLPELEPQWLKRYAKVVATQQPAHFEDRNEPLKKDFEVMAFPAGGNLFGVTFTDITERRKAEQERESAQQELAQLQKMEAVGQLAGGIAHDFNNQMAGVLGYAEMLKERLASDPKLARFINNIIVGIRRASDLTAQLLAFARKGKYLSVAVNMHNVILEVVNLLEHAIDKKIAIKQQFNARPPVAMGDPTQLQNVILNIAINARDAMPEGGELTFATDVVTLDGAFCEKHPHEVTPGRFLRISVTDTGTGIDKETMKRIFEPFFTTKPRGKGTGMGLAAAYGTVKNHHGAITVYSEVGKGSTFNVYLPLSKEQTEEEEAVEEVKRLHGNPHILVVDDEALVAEMAVDMLSELGCQVTHCDNGREAVEYYERSWKGVDLVILDMVMPEMNGYEAFKRMKVINPKLRALLSSGYAMNGDAQKMLEDGAMGFVQKPYHRAELARTIQKILAGRPEQEPGSDVFKRDRSAPTT